MYFSEDMEEASKAVDETLMMYNDFLEQLTKSQRQEVLRTIGLKMQELKAQKINLEEESLQEWNPGRILTLSLLSKHCNCVPASII